MRDVSVEGTLDGFWGVGGGGAGFKNRGRKRKGEISFGYFIRGDGRDVKL